MNHPIWLNHVLIERNRSSKAHAPTHRLKDWNGKKTKPRTAKKWGAAETRLKIALGLLSCRVCPCSHGLFTESKQATSGTDSRKKKKSFQTEQFRTIGTGHCRDLKSPSPLIVRNLMKHHESRLKAIGGGRRCLRLPFSGQTHLPEACISSRDSGIFGCFNSMHFWESVNIKGNKNPWVCVTFLDRYLLFKFFLIKSFTSLSVFTSFLSRNLHYLLLSK